MKKISNEKYYGVNYVEYFKAVDEFNRVMKKLRGKYFSKTRLATPEEQEELARKIINYGH